MTEMEDKLLNQFLQAGKREVEDNHFSKRVMRSLPASESKMVAAWVTLGSMMVVVLFFVLGGAGLLLDITRSILNSNVLIQLKQTDPMQLAIVFVILATLGIKRACSTV